MILITAVQFIPWFLILKLMVNAMVEFLSVKVITESSDDRYLMQRPAGGIKQIFTAFMAPSCGG